MENNTSDSFLKPKKKQTENVDEAKREVLSQLSDLKVQLRLSDHRPIPIEKYERDTDIKERQEGLLQIINLLKTEIKSIGDLVTTAEKAEVVTSKCPSFIFV